MKTTIKTITAVLLIICSTILPGQATAGNFNLGVGVSSDISSSGLGINRSPKLIVGYKNHSFAFGLNYQKRNMNFSGFQGVYKYVFPTCQTKRSDLFVFGDGFYHQTAYLGKRFVKSENYSDRDNNYDFENINFKVIELYAGFGMNIWMTKHLSNSFGIGMGMHHTLESSDACKSMIRENSGASLLLKCGLAYTIKKHTTN